MTFRRLRGSKFDFYCLYNSIVYSKARLVNCNSVACTYGMTQTFEVVSCHEYNAHSWHAYAKLWCSFLL